MKRSLQKSSTQTNSSREMGKTKLSNMRLGVIQILIVIWVIVICARLVGLQVSQHEELRGKAERQQQATITLTPKRGVIYDRNGSELARSVQVKSLYATPAEVADPEGCASKLAKILDMDSETIYRRLMTRNLAAVAIKRKLTDVEASAIEALGLPGMRFVPEMKRFYVTGATAAHVLGFVDFEEQGKSGVEQAYDQLICGSGGRLLLEVDALKKSYDHQIEEWVPGASVTLTLDTVIQHYVEKALVSAVRTTGSRGGTIVVMRPGTGEILALANAPTFDPNKVSLSNETSRCNRAVEVAFEPGSIFKMITYSAALEEGLIRPNSLIDCGNGEIRLPGRVIRDGHPGVLTAAQALAKSSNVAAIKLGQRLGNARLASYIEAFGFGRRTGIELPAESRGILSPVSEWTPASIGSIPMGHEIGVTAVQAVAAFACIANGGEWVRPVLVKRVNSSSGDLLEEPVTERRRVVSEATAETLSAMLEGVVVRGTGTQAQIAGYRAAGKTGTAQKVDEAAGRYSQTRYVASFAGFAPVKNPEIACIVSLDEPRGVHLGGETAAPVFAKVVAEILHILGVPPEDYSRETFVAADFRVYDVPLAVFKRASIAGSDESNNQASGDAGQHEVASKPTGTVKVPNLVGRGIREAAALCRQAGLKLKATGDGTVSTQSPVPGKLVTQNTICAVRLSKEVVEKDLTTAYRPRYAVASGQQTRTKTR
jgi:cell division protein FtsI/penicillin-binding protein 2